jgi:phosphate transport system substrate-binding protein
VAKLDRKSFEVVAACWALLVGATLSAPTAPSAAELSGAISIDGSSTVYPISKAIGAAFEKAEPGVRVAVAFSGTGGGFKKFCAGETDISDASRPITAAEAALCRQNGIRYVELPVAFDGLAVLVNPKNDWARCVTVKELKALWEPEAQGKVTRWSQVRAGWPDQDIHLYGADAESGTYDYFTQAIVGKEHLSRTDYRASEDDEVLAKDIADDPFALGFFGLAYYEEHKDVLKLVAVDDEQELNGQGCILPTPKSVETGAYQPLARPIFIYVARRAVERPEVQAFVKYYLAHAGPTTESVGYVPLPASTYERAQGRFDRRVYGSLFGGKGSQVGVTMEELAAQEGR